MKPQTFEKFKNLIYQKSGITLGPHKVALVSSRIAKRMRALKIDNHEQYLKFVVNDSTSDELVHLLDSISTNVTSFFREDAHFQFLGDLVREWDIRNKARFRIWCAASSTGEEPYTIAISVLEALGAPHPDFKILATDISTRVLDAARQGEYSANKLEPVPRTIRDKYFDRSPNGYRIKESVRRLISFNRLNLSEPPFPMKGPMDIVFCRNVMIYFDNAVRSRLLQDVHRLLKPGGYLLIGHSENLTGLNARFNVVKPAVYIKA
jgi:chemotaxis protein methyltransferase CheR